MKDLNLSLIALMIVSAILVFEGIKIIVRRWINKPFEVNDRLNKFCLNYDKDLISVKTTLDLKFKEIDKKFEDICRRLEGLERKLDQLEERFIDFISSIPKTP